MLSGLIEAIVARPWFVGFALGTLLLATHLPLSDDRWAKDAYQYFRTAAGTYGWMALHWAWMLLAIGVVALANKPLLAAFGPPLPRWGAYVLWGGYAIMFLGIRFCALRFLRNRMERRIAQVRMATLLGAYMTSGTEGDTRS